MAGKGMLICRSEFLVRVNLIFSSTRLRSAALVQTIAIVLVESEARSTALDGGFTMEERTGTQSGSAATETDWIRTGATIYVGKFVFLSGIPLANFSSPPQPRHAKAWQNHRQCQYRDRYG